MARITTVTNRATGKRGYLFAKMGGIFPIVSIEDIDVPMVYKPEDLELDPETDQIHIDDPYKCGFGQGPKNCIYLMGSFPPDECARGTKVQAMLEKRHTEGSLNSEYRPTAMYPDCQVGNKSTIREIQRPSAEVRTHPGAIPS